MKITFYKGTRSGVAGGLQHRWAARQACDGTIMQETLWQGAAKLIRDYRLKAKEDVKRAITIEEVESAMIIWNGFVVNIRSQLGVGL